MILKKETAEHASYIAEIIAAAAVVISLIYLSVQVTDNTKELKSQSHYNALVLFQRPLELLIRNKELADIIITGYENSENLSPSAKKRFDAYHMIAFNSWEFLYMSEAANTITKELHGGGDAYFRELIKRNPGLDRFWSAYKVAFAPEFVVYVDEIIKMFRELQDNTAIENLKK